MRCALVIPAWQPEELFSTKTIGSQLNYWEPLGILYIAASLIRAGHEVRFFNGAFLSHAQIMHQLAYYAPQFVGLYSTTFGWEKAIKTAIDIKHRNSHTFVCVGGPYPTVQQAVCLQDNYCIDAVVVGEGEVSVPEIVECLQAKRPLHEVQGIVHRHDGYIITNPARPLLEDLDSLAFPARELLETKRYLPPPAMYRRKPVAVVLTSRGCNRRCIFCSQMDKARRAGKHGIRFRSVENVLEEIELCLHQGYKEIKFIDDSLAADYQRLFCLTQKIKERKLDFTWFASACVNQVDRPLLQAMKDAGCWAVLFGVESGVQKNLNTLRKGTTVEQIKAAVQAAKEVGLKVTTSFLLGIPGETYEEGLKTIDFALQLNPDFANFHALTAFPGTYLYEHRERYGTVSEDLSDYNYQAAAFVPFTLTREQIQSLRQLAFKRFYSRPAFLIRRILQLRHWRD